MNRVTDTELKKYYSEISKSVLCTGKHKRTFMKQLKFDIDSYISENPEATLEEVKNCFGTADTIAESFIVNSDCSEIKRKLDIKKLLIVAVVAALLVYLAFIVISLIDVHTEAHGYFSEGILVTGALLKDGVIL